MLVSCGKVTQETTEKNEPPSFNIQYSVDVENTETDLKLALKRTVKPNSFSIHHKVFASVSAYFDEGASKELSWGKAIIYIENPPEISSANVAEESKSLIVKSKAYNKSGREITSSSHTWTEPSYNKSSRTWKVDSKKILKGYDVYQISFYDEQENYRFKLIDQEMVSGNTTVNLGDISEYDTFIALLGMQFLEKNVPKDLELGKLMALFDIKFFEMLSYQFPQNSVKLFDVKKPVFQFNRPLETFFVTLYQLYIIDPGDALKYLEGLEVDLFGEPAYKYLKGYLENAAKISSSSTN